MNAEEFLREQHMINEQGMVNIHWSGVKTLWKVMPGIMLY